MIPFNVPLIVGDEKEYINQVFLNKKFSGKGSFTQEAQKILLQLLEAPNSKALLTTSCTDALEMSALLSGITAEDEVIMPSYTFVSTANAFALRGAKIVFVDIETNSMNLSIEAIERAVTKKTKVIVLVHYAGMCCDMAKLKSLCEKNNIILIEDAAQAITSDFKGKKLGTWGDLSCFSFHDTKNIHCGEGGALVINNPAFFDRSEIIIEKGTNRTQFVNGLVDKYTWHDIGSSFLLSEINAAFLVPQLKNCPKVISRRLEIWDRYYSGLKELIGKKFDVINPIEGCHHNAHLFALIVKNKSERTEFISHMKTNNVQVVPHYIPLHSSPAGQMFGKFVGEDKVTTDYSERLVRLPMFFDLTDSQVDNVIESIKLFFK